jgi:hypothetical protein
MTVFRRMMQEGESPRRKSVCVWTPVDNARFVVAILTSSERELNVEDSYRQRERWRSFQLEGQIGRVRSVKIEYIVHSSADQFEIFVPFGSFLGSDETRGLPYGLSSSAN